MSQTTVRVSIFDREDDLEPKWRFRVAREVDGVTVYHANGMYVQVLGNVYEDEHVELLFGALKNGLINPVRAHATDGGRECQVDVRLSRLAPGSKVPEARRPFTSAGSIGSKSATAEVTTFRDRGKYHRVLVKVPAAPLREMLDNMDVGDNEDATSQYVVLVGELSKGFEAVGPFDSEDEAASWAGGPDRVPSVVKLTDPTEFEDSDS